MFPVLCSTSVRAFLIDSDQTEELNALHQIMNIAVLKTCVNPETVCCCCCRAYTTGINLGAQAFGPVLFNRRHNWRWRKRKNEPWFSATPLWDLELILFSYPEIWILFSYPEICCQGLQLHSVLYARRQKYQTYYNILFQYTAPGLNTFSMVTSWY